MAKTYRLNRNIKARKKKWKTSQKFLSFIILTSVVWVRLKWTRFLLNSYFSLFNEWKYDLNVGIFSFRNITSTLKHIHIGCPTDNTRTKETNGSKSNIHCKMYFSREPINGTQYVDSRLLKCAYIKFMFFVPAGNSRAYLKLLIKTSRSNLTPVSILTRLLNTYMYSIA